MHFLMAFFSAAAHSMNSISLRVYQTRLQKSNADLRLFQGLYMLLASLAYCILIGFSFSLDPLGWALALCYGLDLALTGLTVSACFQCGPMSVTSVISNACVALPIAVGCIFYQEVMHLPQIIGCVLLAITFLLPCLGNRGEGKIALKWYPLVVLAFFFNGMGAVLLNVYGREAESAAQNAFLAVGYGVAALIYLGISMVQHARQEKTPGKGFFSPLLGALLLTASMGGFIGNGLLMSLNTVLPASVLYPMVNGGIGVLVAIVSCTVFKEKLTTQKLLAILTGLGAIVLLNL